MKRLLIYIIGVALMMTACEFHTSDNGDLDGFWQLSSVDTLATGGTRDLRYDQLSWSFQGRLVELRDARDYTLSGDLIGRFQHHGDSLSLSDFYFSKRDSGDIRLLEPSPLRRYGVSSLQQSFQVLQLGGSRMTLQSDSLRLNFRRY